MIIQSSLRMAARTAHNLHHRRHLWRGRRFDKASESQVKITSAPLPPHLHARLIEIHQEMLAPGRPGFVVDETTFAL